MINNDNKIYQRCRTTKVFNNLCTRVPMKSKSKSISQNINAFHISGRRHVPLLHRKKRDAGSGRRAAGRNSTRMSRMPAARNWIDANLCQDVVLGRRRRRPCCSTCRIKETKGCRCWARCRRHCIQETKGSQRHLHRWQVNDIVPYHSFKESDLIW